jgi:hypothetical protein
MKTKGLISLFILWALIFQAYPGWAKDDFVSKMYNNVDNYLNLRDKLPTAKDSMWSWVPFSDADRGDIQDDINSYLDRALTVLLNDEAITIKNDILRLEAKNRSLQDKIAQYGLEKATAPTETSKLKFWTNSASQLDDKIQDANNEIRANNAQINRKMIDIKSTLSKSKIYLSDDQIKTLLITVSGQDQLDAIVALKNLYGLTDTLKDLMKSSSNLTVSKKYYGVFLLATEAHQRQLVLFMKRIDDRYLPKLKQLQAENRALMAETRQLAAGNKIYQSNLAAQQITDDVAIKYQDLLLAQKKNLEVRLSALMEVLKYVDNTYRTVNLASGLATSMEEGLNTLQAILEMPILPPVAFENNLEATFLELSAKISGT